MSGNPSLQSALMASVLNFILSPPSTTINPDASKLLVEELKAAPDLETVIRTYASTHTHHMPSVVTMTPLLDMLNVERRSVSSGILSALVDKLVILVSQLPPDKYRTYLSSLILYRAVDELRKFYKYAHVPELHPVLFAALKAVPNIPSDILSGLAHHDDMMERCPIDVKQRVWQLDSDAFKRQVLDQELRVDQLVECIGSSPYLYMCTVDHIAAMYGKNSDTQLCLLRYNLLLAFKKNDAITRCDPVNQLAYALDHGKYENYGILAGISKCFDVLSYHAYFKKRTLVHCAMLLVACEDALIDAVLKCVEECVSSEQMPSQDVRVQQISLLLSLASRAASMCDGGAYTLPSLPVSLMSDFYPLIAAIMLNDQLGLGGADASPMADSLTVRTAKGHPVSWKVLKRFAFTRGEYHAE